MGRRGKGRVFTRKGIQSVEEERRYLLKVYDPVKECAVG